MLRNLVFRTAAAATLSSKLVVLFVGDQIPHDAIRQYCPSDADADAIIERQDPQWQARRMMDVFPGHDALVVFPARLEQSTFACYDQFLTSTTSTGEPVGYRVWGGKETKALHELAASITEAVGGWAGGRPSQTVASEEEVPQETGPGNSSARAETGGSSSTLGRLEAVQCVAFSKGGVVLNQLLAEMGTVEGLLGAKKGDSAASLAHVIRGFHYLDCGLNSRGAHITDPAAVGNFMRWWPKVLVSLHGTPRQWADDRRDWILKEKNRFVTLCNEAGGGRVNEQLHMADQEPSLLMHFSIFDAFRV